MLHEDGDTDTYEHLKGAILQLLCPDTEDRLVALEKLSRRRLRVGESIDELACDVEKLLDQPSPRLPEELCESELRFNLINVLPEKVSFQLKLQPKCSYVEAIARGKELFLIYSRAETQERVNQIQTKDDQRLQRLEETMQLMTEQLTAISVQRSNPSITRCFKCGKRGHFARNFRTRIQQVQCFNCGGQGHIAQNYFGMV